MPAIARSAFSYHIARMHAIEAHNAADYLRSVGWIDRDEEVTVHELAGGVSNVVFYVQRQQGRGADFVLKQARGQLRVEQPWFCSVQRIWREVEVLRICHRIVTDEATVCVPEVLFEDRDNYAFAMTAAPRAHVTWKQELMAGEFSLPVAAACGTLLGRLHAGTWNDQRLAAQLGDRQHFEDLRIDPYFRRVGEVHADLKSATDQLIAALDNHRRCLVHGDFSPKNLLIWQSPDRNQAWQVMLVDCEVGHYGDPAFDLGFFLSHLVLKSIYHREHRPGTLPLARHFWQRYCEILQPAISPDEFDVLQQRALRGLGGCLLARVDGKSPVEYLQVESQQQIARQLGRELLTGSPDVVVRELDRLEHSVAQDVG